jgi:hypothetical protein
MRMKIRDNSYREKTMTGKTCLYNIVSRQVLAIILILLTSLPLAALSSSAADNSTLIKLISQNEDPRMNVRDLAFLLVTHDFDAIPKKDYVEVHIDGSIYKLVPNGQYPGLANETVTS